MDEIIDHLVRVYYEEETWHKTRMPKEEAVKYHRKMYEDGCILVYRELNVVLGYIEVWRINFEQFGRLICKHPFSSYLEDVRNGNIAYVANTWVDKKFRGGSVMKMLSIMFFAKHYDADYFVGERMEKKSQPVKVFNRAQLQSKLFTIGERNG